MHSINARMMEWATFCYAARCRCRASQGGGKRRPRSEAQPKRPGARHRSEPALLDEGSGMARREEGTAARTAEEPGPDRAQLEEELASARRALDETLEAVQDGPDLGSRSLPIAEAVAHLRTLVASRMEELEEKRAALEAANAELRSLMRNLDSIVRQRTRALAESESQLRRKNVEL